jgi:hypothetical protein
MILPGARNQVFLDEVLDFSGTVTNGGTAQALLPQQPGRSYFFFENTSSANLSLAIGPPRATATLTSGVVTAISIPDGGMSFTAPPQVVFLGGLVAGDFRNAPQNPAVAQAQLTSGAVSGTTISSGGSGYLVAPIVMLLNPLPLLGGGTGTPSATAGIIIVPNGSFVMESSFCTAGAVSVFGGTTGQAFVCKVGGF